MSAAEIEVHTALKARPFPLAHVDIGNDFIRHRWLLREYSQAAAEVISRKDLCEHPQEAKLGRALFSHTLQPHRVRQASSCHKQHHYDGGGAHRRDQPLPALYVAPSP